MGGEAGSRPEWRLIPLIVEGIPGEAAATDRDEVLTFEELTERMRKGLRAEAAIDTEGVRRRIVAAPESGVTVAIKRKERNAGDDDRQTRRIGSR